MRGRGWRPVLQPWRLWLACLPVAVVPAFDVWDLDAPWAGSLQRELVASAVVTLAMAALASGAFWAVVLVTTPLRRSRAAGAPRLRLSFEAGAGTCLWAADDATSASYGVAVDPASLPLSTATIEHVEAMVARFDGSLDWDDPAGPSPWGPAERAAFERDAAALGEHLAAELGPGFELRLR